MRARLRTTLLLAIAVLYVVSVPWYRPTGSEVELCLGLPDWVAIALACYVGVAILNGAAWLLTEMPAEGVGSGTASAPECGGPGEPPA